MASSLSGRFKELLKKYGKVALGVHFSVSTVSLTGLYIAIKNNADVESIFAKLHLPGVSKEEGESQSTADAAFPSSSSDGLVAGNDSLSRGDCGDDQSTAEMAEEVRKHNRTAELAASTGGALALAVLCNKALFPVRVPITIALTPPIARFLARRRIFKNSVR